MQSLIEHLEELRKRIIVVVSFFILCSGIGIFLSGPLIRYISDYFKGQGIQIIVTSPLEFISAQLKLALLLGLILCLPIIIYETILFIKPALKNREKRMLLFFLPASVLLFVLGLIFSIVVLKTGLWFLAKLAQSFGVLNLWSLSQLIDFIFTTSLCLGLVFQFPILLLIITKLGIITPESIKGKRRLWYVGIFVIAAVVTPTVDPITMLVVAIPLLFLFEISIILIKIFK